MSYPSQSSNSSSGAFFMVATILLGLAVGIGAIFSVLMWADAHQARDDAKKATPATASGGGHSMAGMPGMDMSASAAGTGSLTSYAGAARQRDALATAHKPYPAALPRRPAGRRGRASRPHRPDRPDRARRQVRRVGVGRRRARAGHPRAPGPAGEDHADEQRRDPALGRLPRRPHRAEQGVRRRLPGQVGQLHVPRQRPGRVHVPLRHEAGADAHRERHVRRDRRRAEAGRAAEGRQELRARRERVVPRARTASASPRSSTWRRRTRGSPTG